MPIKTFYMKCVVCGGISHPDNITVCLEDIAGVNTDQFLDCYCGCKNKILLRIKKVIDSVDPNISLHDLNMEINKTQPVGEPAMSTREMLHNINILKCGGDVVMNEEKHTEEDLMKINAAKKAVRDILDVVDKCDYAYQIAFYEEMLNAIEKRKKIKFRFNAITDDGLKQFRVTGF